MTPHEPIGTNISDRRRHDRRSTQGKVRLSIETTLVEGFIENISRSGLLFFSDGELRVNIEVEEAGKVSTRAGRLVRAQRMRGDSFGWAVEFDA